jgi:Tfp pilus assembly protein PilV
MKISPICSSGRHCRFGFTLAEVLISVFIAALSVGGIIYAYTLAAQQAELSTCSSAAQLMAMKRLEQVRAAKWDPLANPPVDELVPANFTNFTAALEVPQTGTNVVRATNVVTITTIPNDPPWKMIQVDCSWSVLSRGPFTNTVFTYRAPDQ